jgi:hypothetical protein
MQIYCQLFQGYSAKQIVVLAMYKGQLTLLRRLAREADSGSSVLTIESLADIRMTTTDNYQVDI